MARSTEISESSTTNEKGSKAGALPEAAEANQRNPPEPIIPAGQRGPWNRSVFQRWLCRRIGCSEDRKTGLYTNIPTPENLRALDTEKFIQDLNEVHMLLDYISGREDKSFTLLDDKISEGQNKLKAADVVNKVSDIQYAFSSRSGETCTPDKAAFLILVKDALNAIARPATGLTIAFTTLFTRSVRSNRAQSAAIAYPSLVEGAFALKKMKDWLTGLAIILSLFGAFLIWQISYGADLASRFDEARRNDTSFAAKVYDQIAIEEANPTTKGNGEDSSKRADANMACGVKSGSSSDVLTGEAATHHRDAVDSGSKGSAQPMARSISMQRACDEYSYQHALYCVAIADLGQYAESAYFYAFRAVLPLHNLLDADICSSGKRASDKGRQEDAKSIAGVLSAISNYFLPLIFGVVGAIASLVRGLGDKVAESVLAPRDLTLSLIRLPVAVVAAVCVGLFLTPTSIQNSGMSSIGAFAMSASGIAFLAGYGAESFFNALDGIIARLFTASKPQAVSAERGV